MASSEQLFRRLLDDAEKSWGLTLLRFLLEICSLIYGAVIWLREGSYRWGLFPKLSLPAKVISVGNITVGGTGKTPLVAFLAEFLRQRGKRVVILSIGYKGKSRGVKVISDGKRILTTSEEAGDEAYLLAKDLKGIPVVVGKDRFQAGRLAAKRFNPDFFLLDDGFQYLRLRRDLDIVVIDASNPFGNGHLLPRGILRERLTSLKRAHLFCLTRVDWAEDLNELKNRLKTLNPDVPVVECVYQPCFLQRLPAGPRVGLKEISGKTVFAFSGIGNPESFERTLERSGAQLVAKLRFRDHHRYCARDLERIAQLARSSSAQWIVTTEKDSVNLPLNLKIDAEIWSLKGEVQVVRGREHLVEAINGLKMSGDV